MTIDEAIAHAREVAAIQRNNDKLNKTLGVISPYYKADCIKCAEEHEQLAEWLEELKMYKSLSPRELISEKQKNDRAIEYSKGFNYGFNTGYNKAIDDFANALKDNYDYLPQILSQEAFGGYIDEYAEQLKAGVKE